MAKKHKTYPAYDQSTAKPPKTDAGPLQQFSFPEHGVTVEAKDQKEALEKLSNILGREVK